jgi:hypothetical protein
VASVVPSLSTYASGWRTSPRRRKFSFRHRCQERAFGWCHPVST